MTMHTTLRKFLTCITVTALLMGACSVMAFAQIGDIDQNGAIDTRDVRLLLRYLTEDEPIDVSLLEVYDLNGDGNLNTLDARLLLSDVVNRPLVTTTVIHPEVVSTRPPQTTTTGTTTTWFDCISTTTTMFVTTTDTTTTTDIVPDCNSTTTFLYTTTTTRAYPPTTYTTTTLTTSPYGNPVIFTVESCEARAGTYFEMDVYVSDTHSLVGLDFEIVYDPDTLVLQTVNEDTNNPYAFNLHSDMFNEDAQWSFTKVQDGTLQGCFVSAADTGAYNGGTMFTLRFEILINDYTSTNIYMTVDSILSCEGGFEYIPSYTANVGTLKIGSATTRPKTTTVGTTDTTTYSTTDTTYPPTTTTTWVLTGPDGTAPTTTVTTTDTTYPPTTTTTWALTGPDGTAPTTTVTTTDITRPWTTTTAVA